ncbi:helix-turn-helix domain-containing protein [Ectobacillus antri]|uniref:helix-turn-helix domain-containing protein n=1 Tax=Ectobacillus antri TaxID=2486280 RepID=UPI000F5A3DBF|nr:helix-turn-helix transcriptional regulator [Ectobacillus antri]
MRYTHEKLRARRKKSGISLTFIAKELGYIGASGYYNIEIGRKKPDVQQARIIAGILNTTIEELFFEN